MLYLGVGGVAVKRMRRAGGIPLIGGGIDLNPVAEVIPSADHLRGTSALDTNASLGSEAGSVDTLVQAIGVTIGE